MRRPRTGLVLAVLCWCSWGQACGASKSGSADTARDPWEGRGLECVRAFVGKDSPYRELVLPRSYDASLSQVPVEARRTALAAGMEPLIVSALQEASTLGPEPSLRLLGLKQDIGLRLISLETQLAAVIFEAECTGELLEAMAFDLDQRTQTRGLVLAVSSLVVGAAFATAAGVWDLTGADSPGPAVLGLTGGLSAAALGAAAFAPREGELRYRHPHNLLVPIVRNEDPDELYPSFVFRLLSLPTQSGRPSPRDLLIKSWRQLIDESVPRAQQSQAEALLYGQGGMYSQDMLALRERLYDALESQLNALARDLELLDRFLVRKLSVQ